MTELKRLPFYLLLWVLSVVLSTAQDDKPFENEMFAIHPKVGYNLNQYQSNFSSFQQVVDCGIFEKGNGNGSVLGLTIERATTDWLHLGVGLNFIDRGGEFTVPNGFPSRDLNTGEVVDVSTENVLEINMNYLEIQPEARFVILPKFITGPLRAGVGFRVGIPLDKSFKQYEQIVSPDNAVFINGGNLRTQTRDLASGDIINMSTAFGISGGIDNLLKIGKKTFLTQGVTIDYNFNNVLSDTEWSQWGIRFELGLRFNITTPEPKPEPEPVIEPEPEPVIEEEPVVVVEEPEPEPEPIVPVFEAEITKIETFSLETGNELLATIPLVNSVFFAKNSAELPGNYITETTNADYFKIDALEAHKYVLPRIAEIIKENPKGTVTVSGYTAGEEFENGGMELARQRAEAVKNALVNLGIQESKIRTSASMTPPNPSNNSFAEGVVENQRADIILNNAQLQEYVDAVKYAKLNGEITIEAEFENTGIVTASGAILEQTAEVINSGDNKLKIGWRTTPGQQSIPFEIEVFSDTLKKNLSGVVSLENTPEKRVELDLDNFEAILRFDYDSSELTGENKELLKQLVELLPEASTITILGSADELGSAERNAQLERQRAANTEQFIKSASNKKFNYETGTNPEKIDNGTPQGRFLNRSIRIRVK